MGGLSGGEEPSKGERGRGKGDGGRRNEPDNGETALAETELSCQGDHRRAILVRRGHGECPQEERDAAVRRLDYRPARRSAPQRSSYRDAIADPERVLATPAEMRDEGGGMDCAV
jgi:hypothetical protein